MLFSDRVIFIYFLNVYEILRSVVMGCERTIALRIGLTRRERYIFTIASYC